MAIKAYFKPGETDITVNGLHQWDEGQTLIIHDDTLPDKAVVYFACSNDKEALEGQFCEKDASCMSVLIPDELLQRPVAIRAWVCESADEYCQTIRTIVLPVIPRAKPCETIPSGAVVEDKVVELDMAYGDQVINASAGKHMDSVTVLKPENLIPSNIKKNVEIGGVVGTMEPTAVSANLENTLFSVIENGNYTIEPTEGFDGMSSVNLSVKVPALLVDANLQDKTIVKNGEYTPDAGYDGFNKIIVDVPQVGGDYKSQDKTVSPSTTEQTITPDEDFDGLSSVKVEAVTNTIDENITAENIKSGISILGVTGSYSPEGFTTQSKTVSPSTTEQTVTPDADYDGLDSVKVEAVTSAIDANITAQNIKAGVNILGVTGSYTPEEYVTQDKTVSPSTEAQTITPDENFDGLNSVTVEAVTSSIDGNITAENIKAGVEILGVTGEYITEFTKQDKTVSPSTEAQTITPDTGYDGLNSVTVEAITAENIPNLTAENITAGVEVLGVTGTAPTYISVTSEDELANYTSMPEGTLAIITS